MELKENVDDKWEWSHDSSAIYSVKLAYKTIMSSATVIEDEFFKKNMG